jgi:O-antigen ligase
MTPLLLVALLQERRGRWLYALAFLAGALGVVYTRSRASLALLGLGTGAVLGLIASRALLRGRPRLLRRVAVLVIGGGLVLLPLAAKVADGVLRRFREAPESSAVSRDLANDAARAMLHDHPLTGVGLNHYVAYLDRGYGDDIEEGDRTIAHHVYWLTGAELGWPGLTLLVLAVVGVLAVGAWTALTARDEWILHVAIGLTVGYGLCHLQHLYEWALRKPQVLFQITALAGVLVRLRALRHGARPAPAPLRHPLTIPALEPR